VNEVNLGTLQSLGIGTPAGTETRTENELGQDAFLELMIAQIQNQDPFKPLENGEFLTQIAQFSQVSGIQDLQTSFSSLAGSLTSNQALQASVLVGRSVLVPGNTATLNNGGSVKGAIDIPATSADVRLQVTNAAGEVVRNLELGPQQAGTVGFNWNGVGDNGTALPPGNYRVSASASLNGEQVALDTLIEDRVNSVTLGRAGEGTVLNLATQGAQDFNSVREIL